MESEVVTQISELKSSQVTSVDFSNCQILSNVSTNAILKKLDNVLSQPLKYLTKPYDLMPEHESSNVSEDALVICSFLSNSRLLLSHLDLNMEDSVIKKCDITKMTLYNVN